MEAAAAAEGMEGLRLPARVRRVIAIRLEQNRPYKEAVRRGLAVLALPGNAGVAARCTARTVDSIWFAAGDRSADFSWYTKRAILTFQRDRKIAQTGNITPDLLAELKRVTGRDVTRLAAER